MITTLSPPPKPPPLVPQPPLFLSIVVVAKAPVAGQCKTRLIPEFGPDGSARLARAMLLDVLTTLSTCKEISANPCVDKILLYAPPTESARALMQSILHEVELEQQQQQQADSLLRAGTQQQQQEQQQQQQQQWTLQPVVEMVKEEKDSRKNKVVVTHNNTQSAGACLTAILQHALAMSRQRQEVLWRQYYSSSSSGSSSSAGDPAQDDCHRGRVVFLGMDCPELPLQELVALTRVPVPIQPTGDPSLSSTTTALLCPAADGGYGLLAVPVNAPHTIFDGVLWSHSLTAVSQLKALTDAGLTKNGGVVLGPLMHDIDTPDDVDALRNRLLLRRVQHQQHQQQQQQQQQLTHATNRKDEVESNKHGGGGDPHEYDRNRTSSSESINCLMRPSALAVDTDRSNPMAVSCRHTWQALQDLGKFDP